MHTNPTDRAGGVRKTALGVVAICWLTIMFDGYDVIMYGAVVPPLLAYQDWAMTPAEAGVIGGLALFGMLIGALVAGTITDIVGRKKIIIASIIWFSLAMALCAIAPTPELLGLFRFVAGLGLGGILPTVSALTIEYSPITNRNFLYTVMFSGYPLGGVIAAALAIPLVPAFGWRVMFWIGLAPLVIVLPLVLRFMPESVGFLLAKGRREEAEAIAHRFGIDLESYTATTSIARDRTASTEESKLAALRSLFTRDYIVATVIFWVVMFLGLLLTYGLFTWLPQIMRESGYPLGSSLSFLLVLNLGGIVGTLFAAAAADRFGSKAVCALAFSAAAVVLAVLSIKLPGTVLYALLPIAGIGTFGVTILLNAYIASHYSVENRATGLGWALGIGRFGAIFGPLLGGFLLSSQLGLEWNFYAFALAATLGAVVILLVPHAPVASRITVEESQTIGSGPG